MSENIKKFRKKRSIYFIAALIAVFCAGFGYAWSILQVAITTAHPEWSVSTVAIIYTLQVSLSCLAPLIFGAIIGRLSVGQNLLIGGALYGIGLLCCGFMGNNLTLLIIFFGIFSGIGVGFIYPTLMAYSAQLLPDKKSLASGLMAAAYGSGAVVWAPVANALIESTSLLTTLKILGAVFLVVIIVMSIFTKPVPEGYIEAYSSPAASGSAPVSKVVDKNRAQMVRTPTFYIMIITFTLATTSGMMVISQAASIVKNTGGATLAANAAICVSIVTLFNTFGRLIWGAISQKIGPYNVTIILFAIAAISLLGAAFIHNGYTTVAFMALIASCFGGFATLITPITANMYGMKYITTNFGTMYVVYAFSSFIGPRLATSLSTTDAAGNVTAYTTAFIVAAVMSIIGIVFGFILKGIDRKNTAEA